MYHAMEKSPELRKAYDIFCNIWLGEYAECNLYIPTQNEHYHIVGEGAIVRQIDCFFMALACSDAEGNIVLANLSKR